MIKKFTAIILFFIILLVVIPFCFCFFAPKGTVYDIPILAETQNETNQALPSWNGIAAVDKIKSYIKEEDTVREIDFEDYITGVVAAEMPASFEDEALKAQAVAARSYILTKIQTNTLHDNGAVVCNDPAHCKAYATNDQLRERWGNDFDKYYNKIRSCVESTKDCIMLYDGQIVNAVFHSTSSGKTESAVDVWGKPVPYLVSVASFGDNLSPKFTSSVTMSIDEFKTKLKNSYPSLEWGTEDQLIGNIERSDAGGIINIHFGNTIISGNELRNLFSLYSTHIEFDVSDTDITMNVTGNGHGVGMSQYGANYLAGQGKNFIEILKTYYSGVEVVKINRDS